MQFVRARRFRHLFRSGVVVALLLAFVGCGEATGELSGTVIYNSKPVRSGTVTVAGSNGAVVQGVIEPDGTYRIAGVPIGTARIGVTSPNPKMSKIHMRKKGEAPPPAQADPNWIAIPEQYADFQKSNLTTDVKSGKNVFNIEMK